VQIDGHPDPHDEFEGNRYSQACPFARVMETSISAAGS
jgi:arginase family enzyme